MNLTTGARRARRALARLWWRHGEDALVGAGIVLIAVGIGWLVHFAITLIVLGLWIFVMGIVINQK